MQPESSPTLAKVIRMFKRYGCDEQTLLTKHKLTQILNKQATINLHHNFSPSIIQEIWGQTETTSRGESTVLTFAKIFSQAMAILQDRISIIDGPTGIMQKQAQLKVEQNKLKELESQYQKGIQQSYDRNNIARKNVAVIEDKIKQLRKNKSDFERDLQEMQGCLQVEERLPTIQRSQYIAQSRLQESTSPPAPSPHLSLIFKVTVLVAFLQMLLLNFHESFLALLCYFLILYWLFLGYYDQYFVKMLIIGLTLSCVLDIVSVCLELMGKLGNNRYYSGQKAWVIVSIIIVIIQVALRVLLLIKLCPFRDPSGKKEYFVLVDHEILLHTRSGKMLSSQQRD